MFTSISWSLHIVNTLSFDNSNGNKSKYILRKKISCKVNFYMLKFIFLLIRCIKQGVSPSKIPGDPSPPTTQSL